MRVSGMSWADFPGTRSEGSPGSSGVALCNYTWLSPPLCFQAVLSQKEEGFFPFFSFFGGGGKTSL